MMFQKFGPFLRPEIVIASIALIYIAVYFWWDGHTSWLILKGKKLPFWLLKRIDVPEKPLLQLQKEIKPHHVYLFKGIGWGIIIVFSLVWLFDYPGRRVSPYKPIIGNITMHYIGEVVFVMIMFLAITNFLRWITRER